MILAVLIALLWGPNLGGAIEYSITGKNSTCLSVANATGTTPYLNSFYSTTYDLLGYDYTPTRR